MNNFDMLALALQILSLEILYRDYNNVDLMNELQRQDKEYFEKLISQNEELLNILKKGENNGNVR